MAAVMADDIDEASKKVRMPETAEELADIDNRGEPCPSVVRSFAFRGRSSNPGVFTRAPVVHRSTAQRWMLARKGTRVPYATLCNPIYPACKGWYRLLRHKAPSDVVQEVQTLWNGRSRITIILLQTASFPAVHIRRD